MEQIIKLSGYMINTKVEGEGPPLLLLHSYWGNLLLFDNLAKGFAQTRKVIRIDLPGHGKSSTPLPDYRFDTFAGILNELLIHLNISGKTTILGHSMGGYAALSYAARYPEKIESLILMHSPVRNADFQSIKLRNREAGLLLKGKKELLLQVTIPSNFAPEANPKTPESIAILNQTANQVTIEGAIRSIEAMNHRRNYLKTLQNAKYPILIIIGKFDKVYLADDQLEDARQIPHADILLLDHSGHLGFMEEEELVQTRLRMFVHHLIKD